MFIQTDDIVNFLWLRNSNCQLQTVSYIYLVLTYLNYIVLLILLSIFFLAKYFLKSQSAKLLAIFILSVRQNFISGNIFPTFLTAVSVWCLWFQNLRDWSTDSCICSTEYLQETSSVFTTGWKSQNIAKPSRGVTSGMALLNCKIQYAMPSHWNTVHMPVLLPCQFLVAG